MGRSCRAAERIHSVSSKLERRRGGYHHEIGTTIAERSSEPVLRRAARDKAYDGHHLISRCSSACRRPTLHKGDPSIPVCGVTGIAVREQPRSTHLIDSHRFDRAVPWAARARWECAAGRTRFLSAVAWSWGGVQPKLAF